MNREQSRGVSQKMYFIDLERKKKKMEFIKSNQLLTTFYPYSFEQWLWILIKKGVNLYKKEELTWKFLNIYLHSKKAETRFKENILKHFSPYYREEIQKNFYALESSGEYTLCVLIEIFWKIVKK